MSPHFKARLLAAAFLILTVSSCSPNKNQEEISSALLQTARSLVEKGNFDDANSILKAVEKISPDSKAIVEVRGLIEQKKKEKISAEENASALLQTARNLVDKDNLDDASAMLKTIEKILPDSKGILEVRGLIEQKEKEKSSVKKNPIAYSYSENDTQIELRGAAKTRKVDGRNGLKLAEDEAWIILNVIIKELSNKYHQIQWDRYFRIITKTGDALSPSIPLVITSINGTPDFIRANERMEMQILFKVKESDAPLKLRFSDGVENELAF